MSKKIFHMTVPFAGFLYTSVSAETEEQAKEKFFAEACYRLEVKDESLASDAPHVELGEWDVHSKLVEGNVCHASCIEISVDEVEELDEG